MKTPITDAAAEPASYFLDSLDSVVESTVARRLEADRAALMEALEETASELDALMRSRTYYQGGQNILERSRATLAAAKANFPESP